MDSTYSKSSITVSAIITAAGKNSRMMLDQSKKNVPLKNKLLLEIQGKPLIYHTVKRAMDSGVDECIIVLGHFKEEIRAVLSDFDYISDDSIDDNNGIIKIIENDPYDVSLSQSLLNGVSVSKGEICLCAAGDQPTITSNTFSKLVETVKSYDNPANIISVLSRGKSGFLNSAHGLGMPFACHRSLLEKYLPDNQGNINPILREMIKEDVIFYGLKCENDLELININRMNDYELILNDFK